MDRVLIGYGVTMTVFGVMFAVLDRNGFLSAACHWSASMALFWAYYLKGHSSNETSVDPGNCRDSLADRGGE